MNPFRVAVSFYTIGFFFIVPLLLGMGLQEAALLPVGFVSAPVAVLIAAVSNTDFISLNTAGASSLAFYGLLAHLLYFPGLLVIAFTVDGQEDIPPGYLFLSNWYVHPAKADFDRSINTNSASPTFNSTTLHRTSRDFSRNDGLAKMQRRELRKMGEEADVVLKKLNEQETRQLEREAKDTSDLAEINKKLEEIERAKARIEARKKRGL